jgi:hypothetical protein
MSANDEPTDPDQAALPGLEIGTERAWILTVECDGLTYTVLIEAMTKVEAAETFREEFDEYEVGVEDDDFDWDDEIVWARSREDAEEIALERDRDYMRTYQAPCLGNTATVREVEPADTVDGSDVRQAKRDVKVVA